MVELLVVTALVGMLGALLLPALSRAREKSRAAVCLGNLRQLGQSSAIYSSEYQVLPTDTYPGYLLWNGVDYLLYGRLIPAAGRSLAKVFYCPSSTVFPITDPLTGVQNLGMAGRVTAGSYYARSASQGAPLLPPTEVCALLADYQEPGAGARSHPGGLNVLYSDGSVQFARVSNSWSVASAAAWAELDRLP